MGAKFNRETIKVSRDQRRAEMGARYGSRLEDKYGDRQTTQPFNYLTLVKCFQCHQMGHIKKQCKLTVTAYQQKKGFQEGSC